MPKITFRPSRFLVKTAEYTSIFLVAFSSLFVARIAFAGEPPAGSGSTTIDLQTWDRIARDMTPDADPGAVNKAALKGLAATGVYDANGKLYKGTEAGAGGVVPQFDGDLIELGYYKRSSTSAPNVDGTNLFVGTWTPLTTATTIGARFDEAGTGWENTDTANDGEFYYQISFTRDGGGAYSGTAQINPNSAAAHQKSDNVTGLGGNGVGHLYDLDYATYGADAGSEARLGIRFYDISQGATTGWNGSNKSLTATKYQTIMHTDWKWDVLGGDFGTPSVVMDLHDDAAGPPTSTLKFEFDNKASLAAGVSKIGQNDVDLMDDYFVTTIAYHDGTGSLDLGNGALGSAIVSGFAGSGTVDGGTDGNVFTINSAAGNTGDDAYTFSGNIYQDATTSTDLTIIKEGGGEQILSGDIDVADSTDNGTTSGYLNIQDGTLTLKPGVGKTQEFEYLEGESGAGLTLDNSVEATQTIVLGFANTSATKTFSGTVTLTGDETANTIKVVSDTAKTTANYDKEQVLSGQVTGTEMLVKDGLGRLKLSNAGNDFTNTAGTDVTINDGTLVAAHAAALGASTNTVVINKGKLELEGGIALANTTIAGHASSSSHKSMVGGDGTFSAITVGDGNNEIDAISPGRGISSSLSPSNQQVTLGTGASAANAMGDLTVTTLIFNDNAVFDWEISDFNSGGNQAAFNDKFDVLNFGDLAFGAGAVVDVNVFSVASNGSAGGVANLGVHSGTDGILFLKGDAHANITNWGGTTLTGGVGVWTEASSHFSVDDRGYNFHNGNLNGGWNVWYNGSGDFYMRYSAVPEPSTYVMVMGLLLVPGFRFFRRFRKKGIKQEDQ